MRVNLRLHVQPVSVRTQAQLDAFNESTSVYKVMWANCNLLQNGSSFELFAYYTQRRLYQLMARIRDIHFLCSVATDEEGDNSTRERLLEETSLKVLRPSAHPAAPETIYNEINE